MIAARDVTVRFGGLAALSGVTFAAGRGELVGVVGAASSGKTVLLKTLCLLVRPDAGSVRLEEVELTALGHEALAAQRARFGFCFQNLALFDRLDATANVAFALVRRGVGLAEAAARARAQLKAVGLEAAVEKMPHEMSGGMRRRLALARAMVSRPLVALYDDPFTGLDPVACARIARLIQRSHRDIGGTTVVAAGDPSPLFGVADRLVLLDAGQVVADLAPAAFRAAREGAVARYLGTEQAA